MKIRFNRIITPTEFDSVGNLYVTAFPPQERREINEIHQLISEGQIFIYQIITANNTVAGFCIFWIFKEFTFIEHLAVFPELRGMGTGEETLSFLREKFNIIILETELPVDEISRRRIKFYERNGFFMLQQQYFQPSYGRNKPEVELKLMCTNGNISNEKLGEFIIQIKEMVYPTISQR